MEELKKFVKKLEKYKSKEKIDDKNYLKELVLNEKKEKRPIEIVDLSIKFGTDKQTMEEVINEINQEEKEKNQKKPKKVRKKLEFFKKIKENLNKLIDKEDKQTLKDFFLKIIILGIPLNFALFVIFGIKFNWYSFLGWGTALWFVKKEMIDIIRSLWIR